MRKEVDRDAGGDTFFVAPEEDFFKGRQAVGFNGEMDFVDDVAGEERSEVVQGEDGVGAAGGSFAGGFAGS